MTSVEQTQINAWIRQGKDKIFPQSIVSELLFNLPPECPYYNLLYNSACDYLSLKQRHLKKKPWNSFHMQAAAQWTGWMIFPHPHGHVQLKIDHPENLPALHIEVKTLPPCELRFCSENCRCCMVLARWKTNDGKSCFLLGQLSEYPNRIGFVGWAEKHGWCTCCTCVWGQEEPQKHSVGLL